MAASTDSLSLVPSPHVQSRTALVVDRLADRLTRHSVVPLSLIMILLIGVGDALTGIEMPFTILYLLPIGLGTWYRSHRFGIVLSLLSTASSLLSLALVHMSPFLVAWNLAGAALLFVSASWAVSELRAYVERERTLRAMAIDQLRHAERLNVIGTLAAGVAHELGTPLNVIAGCAELIAETNEDASIRKRTTMILEQIQKVSSIIRRLLDFGHRGRTETTTVDLNALAHTATELLQSTARKRGCSIVLDPGPDAHTLGNAPELEQVLSNLILNGLQAMHEGEVHVQVGVDRTRQIASIAVEDQGSGIPPEHLPRIFDPFFTTKGVGEGTGLGLSVSYGIVRDHRGTIEVDTTPGRGSRFTVLLPLAD
jgi:signal transduction histidine kinase